MPAAGLIDFGGAMLATYLFAGFTGWDAVFADLG